MTSLFRLWKKILKIHDFSWFFLKNKVKNKGKIGKNRFFDFFIYRDYIQNPSEPSWAVGISMFSNPKFDELYEKIGFAWVAEGHTLNFNEKPLKTPIFTLFSRFLRLRSRAISANLFFRIENMITYKKKEKLRGLQMITP